MPEDVACPECAQQPHEACRWGDIAAHPPFHAGRIEAASFIAGVETGRDSGDTTPTTQEMADAVDASGLI